MNFKPIKYIGYLNTQINMEIKQLYTNCLSQAAYFIADNGEAAVIDPLRDTDSYINLAKQHNAKIKYIFETHFHADFISGHLELATKTGATIVFGKTAQPGFKANIANDDEEFCIGKIKIKSLHTPGHTLESTCYLLYNETGEPHSIFTGDTLFVGDVGRPDLLGNKHTARELAEILFDSLHNKILPLANNIIVYPAHGAGSACGKNIGKETFSTIGIQKATNYALIIKTKEEFVKAVTYGLCEAPAYFSANATINRKGYNLLEEVFEKSKSALSVNQFKEKVKLGAVILDTREATVFTAGFIQESISIGLEGRFAEWAGIILPQNQDIVLVTAKGKEEESILRLARVGIENVVGFLDGGFEAWINAGENNDLIIDIEPDEFAIDLPYDDRLKIIDVRKKNEFEDAHIKGATNIPLDTLTDPLNVAMIEDDKNLYLHCAGGYRSVIAASLLKRHGYHNLRNVLGGFNKIKMQKSIKIVLPNIAQAN